MERCYNTEALNKHMAELDEADRKASFIEDKIKEVEEKFKTIAIADTIDEACYYLAGAFTQEALENAIDMILNLGSENDYFEQLILAKAEELLEADQNEPDAPDYD